jgi:small subunit ribosomal protein S6
MRHYEIVILVHPDQSELVPAMIDRYRTLLETNGGTIHRLEDWGRRQLAFMIDKVYKAHYVLMNIECDNNTLSELTNMFKFSDAVIRNLIIRKSKAVTEPSIMSLEKIKEDRREESKSESSTSERAEKEPIESKDENMVEPESNEPVTPNDTSDAEIELDAAVVTERPEESSLPDLEKKEVK